MCLLLFRSDPEEIFSLWMQNCFPDASLAREDAIREWLTTPLEARVLRNNNHPAEIARSNGSEMPAAAPGEAGDGGYSNETGTRKRGWLRWSSHLLDSSEEDPFADRFASWLRKNSRALLQLAKFALVLLLFVKVLGGVPMDKVSSQADAAIAATQLSKAEPVATANVLQRRQAIMTKSDFAAVPMTIENV